MAAVATAADFTAALAACRQALEHGADLTGADLVRIIRVIEFGANTLDTTAILPAVALDPIGDT